MEQNDNFVGSIKWRLFRYEVMMPVQENNDLLEWLYISLIIHQNELKTKSWDSYLEEEQEDAERIIREKFPDLFDEELLKKVKIAAQKDFVADGKLRPTTMDYISSFESLFTERVEVYQVYQDGLTGSVLPDFSDLSFLETRKYQDDNNKLVINVENNLPRPSKRQIVNALRDYKNYTKYIKAEPDDDKEASIDDLVENRIENTDDLFNEPDIYDPDAEVDFETDEYDFDSEEKEFEDENSEQNERKYGLDSGRIMGHSHVIFLDGSKSAIDIQADIYVIDNRIVVDSPFILDSTKRWIEKRLVIAAQNGHFPSLKEYINTIKENYIHEEDKQIENPLENAMVRKSTANQLKYFGNTYKLIESINEDSIKRLLIDADSYLESHYIGYFNTLRKYLEGLIYPIRSWDYSRRSNMTFRDYCNDLEMACKSKGINASPLMSDANFKNWKRMEVDKKGRRHKEPMLKPDLAEILMTNPRMATNKYFYKGFLADVFFLYGIGSNDSHYNKANTRPSPEKNKDDIDKIFNVTQAILGLYEVKNGKE